MIEITNLTKVGGPRTKWISLARDGTRPRATSAGLADTGAVVSLRGWDSVFHIRSAPHLKRLRNGTQWELLSVVIKARVPDELSSIVKAVDRAARATEPGCSGATSRKPCENIGMSSARITVFTKLPVDNDPAGTLLSKRITLVDDRVISDGSPCRMATGDAKVVPVPTAADFVHVITTLGSDNALALGTMKEHVEARIVTARTLAKMKEPKTSGGWPVIARSRSYIDYEADAAWMLCDFDRKGMPATVATAIADRGGMWLALLSVVPGLAQAARVMRASTSAGLRRIDTGDALSHSGGEHHYILAADGTDIARALKTLHDLCWLHGLGWYLIGASGQMLDRSIVDSSVGFGERLCFEGAPQGRPAADAGRSGSRTDCARGMHGRHQDRHPNDDRVRTSSRPRSETESTTGTAASRRRGPSGSRPKGG